MIFKPMEGMMLIFKLMFIAGVVALAMLAIFYILDFLYRGTTKPAMEKAGSSSGGADTSHTSAGVASVGVLGAAALAASSFSDDDSCIMSDDSSLFDDDSFTSSSTSMFDDCPGINPANGLPMVGCIDIEGNAYGTDSSHDELFSSSSMFDDSLSTSSFDDTFSSSSMFDD